MLKIVGIVYLILGFIYAVYIAKQGTDRWYMFPFNVVFGPLVVVYIVYITITGKKILR